MSVDGDPFVHHPELRELISDPLQSWFRGLTLEKLQVIAEQHGVPVWWHSDEAREALRAAALTGREDGDLWVFAYGSLMWDPGFLFAEVRRARVAGHARRFILKDIYGARGTPQVPGLMAALDEGEGCDGLAFRIAGDLVEAETEVIWRREQVGPAYEPHFVEAETADGPVRALTFVADHDAALIDASLTREQQIHYIATGSGFAGSSMDYLRNIHRKFVALGIEDAEVDDLLRDSEAYLASLPDLREG